MAKVVLTDDGGAEVFSKDVGEFDKAEIIKRERQHTGVIEVFSLEKRIVDTAELEQYNSIQSGTIELVSSDGNISKGIEITGVDEYKITTNRSDELTEQLSFLGIIE